MRDIPFFANMFFFLFSAEPLYQNVRIDRRIIFDFWLKMKKLVNHKSDLGFGSFIIFLFSVYLENSSRITFAPSGGGPLPGPQGVRMGGGPLPGP